MPSPKENKVPAVDTTSLSCVIRSESSCLPPHHPVFPEPFLAADIPLGEIHGRSALSSPVSSAFASTSTAPTDSLPLPTASTSVPPNLPVSSPPSTAPSGEIISQYFCTKIPYGSPKRAKRIKQLAQAAKGFWNATLQQRRKDASTILLETDTGCFCSIYIAHQVGLRLAKAKLRQGEGLLTPALQQTARELSIEEKTLKNEYKWSKRYTELTLLGGPGSLLLTGRNKRVVWQRGLGDGDVKLLLGYRAKHIPHHYTKAVELNTPASKGIIEYMVKRGCRYEELACDESELMCCLGKYIDVKQLAREEKGGFTLTLSPTLSHPGKHSGNRSPDHRTPEGASEELALLLEAAEERDITDFMKTFQEDSHPFPTSEPDITEYMETFDRDIHFNPWIDPLLDIPAPSQQDHLQGLLPHPLVAGVDSCNWVDNQDAVTSGHAQGHNQECGDVSRGWDLEGLF